MDRKRGTFQSKRHRPLISPARENDERQKKKKKRKADETNIGAAPEN